MLVLYKSNSLLAPKQDTKPATVQVYASRDDAKALHKIALHVAQSHRDKI